MTTIAKTTNDTIVGNYIYTWAGMAAGDDGVPAGATGSGDRTVQVQGTFGVGGTVLLEGSLDGSNWYTLRDPSGTSLSFTSAGLKAVLENIVSVRPRVSNGDISTSITVILSIRRDRNG